MRQTPARLLLLGSLLSSCLFAAPTHRGEKSDHFDGQRFFNPSGARPNRSPDKLLQWQGSRKPGVWGKYRQMPYGPRPPVRVGSGELRVTFINHATTLIQQDGVNIITDPIYSERCAPTLFIGPKRVRPPGLKMTDLPRLDAVVLSHNHYDHMDVATLKKLQRGFPKMRVFAGLGNKAFLEGEGLKHVTELDWWQSAELGPVRVTSVPNQHFSNRGITDADGTLWTAFVIAGAAGKTYFAGDTGYGPHFEEVGRRQGPFRLAILPIGAYLPEWFMAPIHVTPEQAVLAAQKLGAKLAVPMHYGTFELSDDGETEPVEALLRAAANDPGRWKVLGFGEGYDVPR